MNRKDIDDIGRLVFWMVFIAGMAGLVIGLTIGINIGVEHGWPEGWE